MSYLSNRPYLERERQSVRQSNKARARWKQRCRKHIVSIAGDSRRLSSLYWTEVWFDLLIPVAIRRAHELGHGIPRSLRRLNG